MTQERSHDKSRSDTPQVDEWERGYDFSVNGYADAYHAALALARKLERDRDVWLADDAKQNAALGRVIAERDALRAIPTAELQRKPVAWRYRERLLGGHSQPTPNWGDWRHVGYEPQGPASDILQIEPLYAAPAPDAKGLLRDAWHAIHELTATHIEPCSAYAYDELRARIDRFLDGSALQSAVPDRLAVIEECAQVCDADAETASKQPHSMRERNEALWLAEAIRALKNPIVVSDKAPTVPYPRKDSNG